MPARRHRILFPMVSSGPYVPDVCTIITPSGVPSGAGAMAKPADNFCSSVFEIGNRRIFGKKKRTVFYNTAFTPCVNRKNRRRIDRRCGRRADRMLLINEGRGGSHPKKFFQGSGGSAIEFFVGTVRDKFTREFFGELAHGGHGGVPCLISQLNIRDQSYADFRFFGERGPVGKTFIHAYLTEKLSKPPPSFKQSLIRLHVFSP